MAEDTMTIAATTLVGDPVDQELTIPETTEQKFPDLIEGIKKSASMNHEERQYWIDSLPVMNDEQVQTLQSILENEKRQIEGATGAAGAPKKPAYDPEKYKKTKEELRIKEKAHEEAEALEEEKLLKELENL